MSQESMSEDSDQTMLLSGKTLDEAVTGKAVHSGTNPIPLPGLCATSVQGLD